MRNMYLINADCEHDSRALTFTQGLAFVHTYKIKRKWNSFYNLLKPIYN